MSSYQDRKDIDKLYDTLYSEINGKLRAVLFTEDSKYNQDGSFDKAIEEFEKEVFDRIYPIGTIYQTTDDSFNPSINFMGIWELIDSTNDIYVWERISETE